MEISLDEAIRLLKKGHVIGVATETVFGLAACYQNQEAVEAIYSLKQRDRKKPLSLLISQKSMVDHLTISPLPSKSEELMKTFWPGPLTIALPVNEKTVPASVRSSLPTIGLRLPNAPALLNLIDLVGPIACSSANVSEGKESTSVEEVEAIFGKDFPIFAPPQPLSREASTVIAFYQGQWAILREGSLKESDFFPILHYFPNTSPLFLARS